MLLFLNGVWWDDWIIYYADCDFIELGYMTGRPSLGFIIIFINSLPNPEVFLHILVFLLYYISTLLLYLILIKVDFLDDNASLFITILFATMYVNEARVLFICLPYAVSNMIFFFAFYLFMLWKDSITNKQKKFIGRIIILILFYISFDTNSFLVFYSTLFIYILYREKNILNYIRYFDFILLPIIFFAIKHQFWTPYGYYINYNKLTLAGIKLAISQLHQGAWYAYTYPISRSTTYYSGLILLSILIILIIVDKFFLKNKNINIITEKNNFELENILLGILFLIIAIFPYFVIFSIQFLKGLNYNLFNTRHLLLTPLGISWITYFLLRYIFNNKKILNITLLIIVLLYTIQWNKTYLVYEMYWYKQVALSYLFKNEEFIMENDTFAFIDVDETTHNSSIYIFYALNGILKKTFNDEKRLMFKIEDFDRIQGYSKYFNKDYLLGDYTGDYSKIDGTIYFESNLTLKDIPILRYYDFVKSTRFETLLYEKNSIRIEKH